jgi:hypothetical protein
MLLSRLRAHIAEAATLLSLSASCTALMTALVQNERPYLHFAWDESRVCKKETMLITASVGDLLLLCPVQRVPDYTADDRVSDEVKMQELSHLATSEHVAPQQPSRRRYPWKPNKAASKAAYGSLSNALRGMCGFNFNMCRSPCPLRPVSSHEVRLQTERGHHFLYDSRTGAFCCCWCCCRELLAHVPMIVTCQRASVYASLPV